MLAGHLFHFCSRRGLEVVAPCSTLTALPLVWNAPDFSTVPLQLRRSSLKPHKCHVSFLLCFVTPVFLTLALLGKVSEPLLFSFFFSQSRRDLSDRPGICCLHKLSAPETLCIPRSKRDLSEPLKGPYCARSSGTLHRLVLPVCLDTAALLPLGLGGK